MRKFEHKIIKAFIKMFTFTSKTASKNKLIATGYNETRGKKAVLDWDYIGIQGIYENHLYEQ